MLLLLSLSTFTACLSLTVALSTNGARSRSTPSLSESKIHSRNTGEDACGRAFQGGSTPILAVDAYNCLVTLPLNQTVASKFIQYYRDTLDFQSTLTYLKNPPSSYQQPPTDLLGGLDQIQRNLDTGVFSNQYEFEVAVLDLVYSAHDGHTYLYAGASNVFGFGSPFAISSVSVDGVQPPEVFLTDDLYESKHGNYTASPIATVNGQPVLEFYENFAKVNSQGYLEPHADWNSLMYSPAADIQGLVNALAGSSPFYPGDAIGLVLKNGTPIDQWRWMAVLNDPDNEGVVSSSSEFYDTFVVYDSVETSNQTSKRKRAATTTTATESSNPSATAEPWSNLAYPGDPFISQPNLENGGVITGYLIEDSTAVLSIPSFDVYDDDLTTFSPTIGSFITNSKRLGAKKVVIDLQQNYGGRKLLAIDTFKHFFPDIDPYGGSRERAHSKANLLGEIYTGYYNTNVHGLNESDLDYLSQSIWVAPNYLDARTEQNFASWNEYFGPHEERLDNFTTTQRENLSNTVFDEYSLGAVVYGYGNKSVNVSAPYSAQDLVILTDGLCASTCALFVEMMHHEAGVETVVVGGLPQVLGPMQTVAGTRGAKDYEADSIDLDIYVAGTLNNSLASQLPDREIDFNVDTANFNLQDQVRKGENFPLQFAYAAANCRIYYTRDSIFDMRALWYHAAQVTWTDRSRCVKHSTDHPSSSGKATDTVGPSPAQRAAWANPPPSPSASASADKNPSWSLADVEGFGVPDDDIAGQVGERCDLRQPGYCKQLACVQGPWCDSKGKFIPNQPHCVRLASKGCADGQTPGRGKCNIGNGMCDYCQPKTPVNSQTCGTATSHTILDDRRSSPRRKPIRF